MSVLLEIKNLSGGYHQKIIIDGISFNINEGDFTGIIGPNGSGKTTLLRLLSRALTPQSGSILLKNQDINKIELKEFCQKAAFVPQETLINFCFTVEEIVLMGRIPHLERLQPQGKRDIKIAAQSMAMTDTTYLKDKNINELSSGERQRVIIAKALTQEPVLLFLDEPTSHLDIGHQIQILDLLRKLNKERNLTIIIVMHELNLASLYCNRIILLDKGKIFKEGSPEEVLTYQNIETVYKTVVVVNKSPISSKPYVTLVPGEK